MVLTESAGPRYGQSCSCFIAGTPVWTESGLTPIEQIQVGDRVLAQDVETGELAYKAVVATTRRAPKELVQLQTGAETLVSTGGHRYWVSGQGWVKARDLQPETWLHTATGNTAITGSETGPEAETHNLVVDGGITGASGQYPFVRHFRTEGTSPG